jgi:hypothetical protein
MANQIASQPLSLPIGLSPDDLDVITELQSVVARLRTPTTLPSATGTTGATPAPTPSQQHNPTQSSSSNSATGEVDLKDFPARTDHLRHKLQRARAAVQTLPDMHRTVAEQEEEIRELEAKMARQEAELQKIRDMGAKFAGNRMQE